MRIVLLTMTVLLVSACGGGGGGGTESSNNKLNQIQQSVQIEPVKVTDYENELKVTHSFNANVADLNGDGLEDVVIAGWAAMPSGWTGPRNSNVPLKILIQHLLQ